jgi:hypothetical protein
VNSPIGSSYEQLWHTHFTVRVGGVVLSHSLREWINDALMVLFFFVVGLEVKREFVCGALFNRRNATLPVIAALGGMVVPAALYAAFNANQPTMHGWGIPMATDIAFALGVLALLGDSISSATRIFLLPSGRRRRSRRRSSPSFSLVRIVLAFTLLQHKNEDRPAACSLQKIKLADKHSNVSQSRTAASATLP